MSTSNNKQKIGTVNKLEVHDRLLAFLKKESDEVIQVVQSFIKEKPFGKHPFYLFCTTRTEPRFGKKAFWQPRLTKPTPAENSMLFKIFPKTDVVHVHWVIPRKEMWDEFLREGSMFYRSEISHFIERFKENPKSFERPEEGDLSDEEIRAIYKELYGNQKPAAKVIQRDF